jgi:hypothetical protein
MLPTGNKLRRNPACRDDVPKFSVGDNICTENTERDRHNTRRIIGNNYLRMKSQWITKGCCSQNFCRPMNIVRKLGEGRANIKLTAEQTQRGLKESTTERVFHKCRVND